MNKSLILWVALWSLVLLSCSDTTREDPSNMIAEWRNSASPSSSSTVVVNPSSSSTVVVNPSSSSTVVVNPSSSSVFTGTTFTDARDGHVYKQVTIGTQVWMAENLAYLPIVNTTSQYAYTTTYYYVYDYSGTSESAAKATSNYSTYGVLYNWTAALTACPSGWHLPTDAEWTTLTDYVGGASVAGTKLKANSTLWSTNTGTDAYGFSALPGGNFNGSYFDNVGNRGYWWSATQDVASNAYGRYMNYNYASVDYYFNKYYGFSARCVQD